MACGCSHCCYLTSQDSPCNVFWRCLLLGVKVGVPLACDSVTEKTFSIWFSMTGFWETFLWFAVMLCSYIECICSQCVETMIPNEKRWFAIGWRDRCMSGCMSGDQILREIFQDTCNSTNTASHKRGLHTLQLIDPTTNQWHTHNLSTIVYQA